MKKLIFLFFLPVVNKSFSDNEEFFKKIFEIGRRYKICNSDKMRSTYGKLLHILQDGVSMNILDFNPCIPIRTVSSLIKEKLTNMDILVYFYFFFIL